MPLAVLVVDRHAAVEQLGEAGGIERGVDADALQGLDLIEQEAPVAVGRGDERGAGILGEGQGLFGEGFGAGDQFAKRGFVEAAQDEHLRAREQSSVERETGILGRGADESDGAVLDIWQETILLGAIEAVDLIDEQQCALAGAGGVARGGEGGLEIGDAGENRRDRREAHADRIGQQAGERRLAGAGRSPEDHRGEAPGGDHAADRAIRAGQMILTDDLGERARPQTIGEGRIVPRFLRRRGGGEAAEQI
jgi:hypothetical protein